MEYPDNHDIFSLGRQYGIAIPPNLVTVFKPCKEFLAWLAEYVGDRVVIEVGAGQCEFTRAMHGVGIRAMAIEPRPSEETLKECRNFLLPLPVARAKVIEDAPSSVVIAARPDHSGWFNDLLDMIHHESELLYIGLEKNLELDMPLFADVKMIYNDAGEGREKVYKVS